ncbi:MAG: hypothetical protein KKB50_21065 [Planctomycetes bacterium]|nr:hypothetical protein [Planctomycetota bacterium]
MDHGLKQLEREAERQMYLLRDLSTGGPSPRCLERIKAQVVAEGLRRRALVVWPAALREVIGIAAALLLAACLSWSAPGGKTGTRAGDPAELLELWTNAVADSGQRMRALFSDTWVPVGADTSTDYEKEFDYLFESLDQSLIIGT